MFFRLFGFQNFFEVKKFLTKLVTKSIHLLLAMMELATYYRFYYKRDLTMTLECLGLFIVCLGLDVAIWKAHLSMTKDPGYLNDSHSILAASLLDQADS